MFLVTWSLVLAERLLKAKKPVVRMLTNMTVDHWSATEQTMDYFYLDYNISGNASVVYEDNYTQVGCFYHDSYFDKTWSQNIE